MSAPAYSIGSKHWPGISKFTEEAGEVLQVIGKLQASGGSARHWTGGDLHTRLAMEIGDVLAAIDFVVAHNSALSATLIAEQRAEKFALFVRWHSEQGGIQQLPTRTGEADPSEEVRGVSRIIPPAERAGRPNADACPPDSVTRPAGSSIELAALAASVTAQLTGHDVESILRGEDTDPGLANDFQCVLDVLIVVERNAAAAPLARLEQTAIDHTVAVCALQELAEATASRNRVRTLRALVAADDVLASYQQPDPSEIIALDVEDEPSKGDA